MESIEANILQGFFNWCLIALGLGLIAFHYVRRANPHLGWQNHGNVWTAPFGFEEAIVAIGIVLIFYAMAPAGGAGGGDGTGEMPEERQISTGVILLGSMINLTIAFAAIAFVVSVKQVDPRELLGINRLSLPKILLWSAGTFFIGLIVAGVTAILVGKFLENALGEAPDPQELVKMVRNESSVGKLLVFFVAAVILAPLAEETLFRGFLYPTIKKHSDRYFAAILTSAIFAVIHGNVASLVPLLVLALVFTIAYELTGCLWVPIGAHAFFNGFQMAVIVFVPTDL